MTFIDTIPGDDAEGATADWYTADRERFGYLPNYTKVFGHRPAAYAAWKQLGGAIGGAMDQRRYELATLAAARVLRSSYCALAHGKILAEQLLGPEATRAVADGDADTVLDPILEAYIEDDASVDELVAAGFDRDTVAAVVRLVDGAEYKRRQAPPGPKITGRSFGKDRRLPITNRFRGTAGGEEGTP